MNHFPACVILSVAFLGKFVAATSVQSGPEDAVSGLMAAWNLKDAQAFASQFTEDATFVNVNGALWIGKKDIEDRHARAAIFKSSHAEIKPDSIRLNNVTSPRCMLVILRVLLILAKHNPF